MGGHGLEEIKHAPSVATPVSNRVGIVFGLYEGRGRAWMTSRSTVYILLTAKPPSRYICRFIVPFVIDKTSEENIHAWSSNSIARPQASGFQSWQTCKHQKAGRPDRRVLGVCHLLGRKDECGSFSLVAINYYIFAGVKTHTLPLPRQSFIHLGPEPTTTTCDNLPVGGYE